MVKFALLWSLYLIVFWIPWWFVTPNWYVVPMAIALYAVWAWLGVFYFRKLSRGRYFRA